MSKELEALECLECLYCEPDDYRGNDRAKDYNTIKQALLKSEKEHKVLEIIKEKNVWIAKLKSLFKRYNNDLDVLRLYNANTYKIDYQLTQEQFDLLKEVLK